VGEMGIEKMRGHSRGKEMARNWGGGRKGSIDKGSGDVGAGMEKKKKYMEPSTRNRLDRSGCLGTRPGRGKKISLEEWEWSVMRR